MTQHGNGNIRPYFIKYLQVFHALVFMNFRFDTVKHLVHALFAYSSGV